MKKLITITMMVISFSVYSQSDKKTLYTYCELVGTQKLLSTKLLISVDFGENNSFIKNEDTGKLQTFNSMIDCLNYMGSLGWEFSQAYTVTIGQQNVYHWILKKDTK